MAPSRNKRVGSDLHRDAITMNETSHFTIPINEQEDKQGFNTAFFEHRCDCCNCKLTNDKPREENEPNIELLYGLHDSPAIHIAFLCGLQVRSDIRLRILKFHSCCFSKSL